jgi:hypothetical protein
VKDRLQPLKRRARNAEAVVLPLFDDDDDEPPAKRTRTSFDDADGEPHSSAASSVNRRRVIPESAMEVDEEPVSSLTSAVSLTSHCRAAMEVLTGPHK